MVRKRAGGVVKDAVTISITQRKLSLGWKGNGGGGGGVWRWYGGEGDGDGVVLGEKRSFEHVFGVEVDGGG